MPIVYIALLERLIGKRAEYIIWDDLTEIKSYKIFDSYRLMKKYAKKHGYYVRKCYSEPKIYFNGIEIKPFDL